MLSQTTKTNLRNLLTLLQEDVPTCVAVYDAAKRRWGKESTLKGIVGLKPNGEPNIDDNNDGPGALETMLREIAEG